MLRRLLDALARRRPRGTPVNDRAPAQEVRAPDPYVWRLPNPHDARWRRWRRWNKRCRAAGRYLPFLEEACRQTPRRSWSPSWRTDDDVVRPYVLRP
ncbi:hypothetical protein SHIRM173S_12667 [Streptomyces hirsutus]